MAYTTEQQGRIDVALARLDAAKGAWAIFVGKWGTKFIDLPCYSDTKHSAYAAATWFRPSDASCTRKGDCTGDDKRACKNAIEDIRANLIPPLRTAYSELGAAQANYDKVLAEVALEVSNDPAVIIQTAAVTATATAAGQVNKQKYIFYGIVVIAIAVVIFVLFKWFKK